MNIPFPLSLWYQKLSVLEGFTTKFLIISKENVNLAPLLPLKTARKKSALTLQSTGGGRCTPLHVVFCPFLKNSSDNPYLKLLDFSRIFNCRCHFEKKNKSKIGRAFLDTQYQWKQNEEKYKFHIWSVGYQNRIKRNSFQKEFLENI